MSLGRQCRFVKYCNLNDGYRQSPEVNIGSSGVVVVSMMNGTEARKLLSSSIDEDFVGALRTVMKEYRVSGWLTLIQVSELTGTSTRSLQRRLAEEGLGFFEVAEQSRRELAEEILQKTNMSLVEIASELGYSTLTNFSRAFKRWTGQSPGDFRDNNKT